MSPFRWALSGFLVWHLLALFVRALPPPDLYPVTDLAPRPAAEGTPVTPLLDTLARGLRPVALGLARITRPVSRPANVYLNTIGFAQQWRMFSRPPTNDQYVRLQYYVGKTQPEWAATELVVPASPEYQARLVRSYLDSTRDKAIMVALENFQRLREPLKLRPDMRPSELPDYVAPVLRYFANRFARQRLLPGEKILRAELWYGVAPMTLAGKPNDDLLRQRRKAVIEKYYDGPVEMRGVIPSYPQYHTVEREGDILWLLDYFEEQ
jgi:hypothetical protein